MEKRGNNRGSHVGMILSFVIFITFIIFLYTILRPAVNITGADKKSIMSYLEKSLIENVSANFTSASVEINNSKNPAGTCVKLLNFLLTTDMSPPTLIVKNETGGIQASNQDLFNLVIIRAERNNRFFKIYYSSEFKRINVTEAACAVLTDKEYKMGLVKTEETIFERKLYNIIDDYRNDYERLRGELKTPPGSEFGIIFTQSNGTKIEVGNTPKSASVYAEEIPVQYIDDYANTHSGYLGIKIW